MYTAEELRNLTEKPRINDISLNILQDYYKMYLMPFIYNYEVQDGTAKQTVELMFDKENFCHLLGIESIVKNNVRMNELQNYKGLRGWQNIEDEAIDFSSLKSINKKKFQSVKAKYVFFYAIPNILESPIAVRFNPEDVDPPVRIQSEILFYNKIDNAVVHLGIDRENGERWYYPRTFFVEKLKDDNIDIYIENQQKIETKKINRTILL